MKKKYTANNLKADIEDYNTRLQNIGSIYRFEWGSTFNQNDLWLIRTDDESNRSRIESGSTQDCKKTMVSKFETLTKDVQP